MANGEDEKMLKDAVESSWRATPFTFGVNMQEVWATGMWEPTLPALHEPLRSDERDRI